MGISGIGHFFKEPAARRLFFYKLFDFRYLSPFLKGSLRVLNKTFMFCLEYPVQRRFTRRTVKRHNGWIGEVNKTHKNRASTL